MNIIRLNSIGEPFAKSGQATPPSGGGDVPSGKSAFRYFDVTNFDTKSNVGIMMGELVHLVKLNELDTGNILFTNAVGYFDEGTPIAFAVYSDFPAPRGFQSQAATCGEVFDLLPPDVSAMIHEITEEQFYAL